MLSLDENERAELWQKLTAEVENHFQQVEKLPVAPKINVAEIRSRLAPLDFEKPLAPLAALDLTVKNLTEFQVHTTHPRYFGLFNHSFIKAARFCDLGTNGVREIETDESFRMSLDALAKQIKRDRADGFAPFFVVATAGTTNAGTIDNLAATAEIAARENLWFHVDAAWGGAAVFVPELKTALDKIERADSITFDAHKWLSVPMGAGIFLTRHAEILSRACRVATDYMPRDADDLGVTDPFVHSMQWSRRFIGLKVFLSLAVAGWSGYEETIRHQTAMGEFLRCELEKEECRKLYKELFDLSPNYKQNILEGIASGSITPALRQWHQRQQFELGKIIFKKHLTIQLIFRILSSVNY